jgi:VWFA-related protein
MTFHTISRTACFAALLALAAAAAAQGPVLHAPPANATRTPAADASTPAADALIIDFPAVIRDRHGDLVPNLTKDSFTLQIDDRPQTIHSVNLDKDPLTLGIVVDTSMSHKDVIEEERTASTNFLDSLVTGEPDTAKAFIVQFARQIDLLQDVTTSKPMLHDAIKQLTSTPPPPTAATSPTPSTTRSSSPPTKS